MARYVALETYQVVLAVHACTDRPRSEPRKKSKRREYSECFRHGDLNMIDVAAIPHRFKNAIGETKK